MKRINVLFLFVTLMFTGMFIGCQKEDTSYKTEVSEEWINMYASSGVSYIESDGKYYPIDEGTDVGAYDSSGIGWKRVDLNTTLLYCYCGRDEETIFTLGDFTPPVYKKGDNFSTTRETLTFQPVEFVGYGIPAYRDKENIINFVTDYSNSEVVSIDESEAVSAGCVGKNGERKGLCGLDKNEELSYCGFDIDGNVIYEVPVVADCRYYQIKGAPIIINTTGDEYRYDNCDLSSLPSGTYVLRETYALITIK
ncbi:MAG: hypothetical protein IKS56_00865 [Lachnospiraceae bacterium]|nr:hypothetical protein [Lachnospiraceae bacterium]